MRNYVNLKPWKMKIINLKYQIFFFYNIKIRVRYDVIVKDRKDYKYLYLSISNGKSNIFCLFM